MIKRFFSIILIVFCFLTTLNVVEAKKLSSFEKNQNKLHIIENSTQDEVLYAVIKVLQDSNFIVKDYNPEVGLIIAEKTFKEKYVNKRRLGTQSFIWALAGAYTAFSWGTTAYSMVSPTMHVKNELRDKTVVITSNVFVDSYGANDVKIRLVMQGEYMQNADGYSYFREFPLKVEVINDKTVYEEFFNQVELFINNNKEDLWNI